VDAAVTVTEVAAAAGVSVATAARALGGYGSVSAGSRERVMAAAKSLGYRPNMVARSMITKTTHTVGVVIADIENPFFLKALRGITDQLAEAGYDALLANTDEDVDREVRSLSVMAARQVDGLIVTPTEASDDIELQSLIARGIPVVLLDRPNSRLAADSVGLRNAQAAARATEFLIEHGHRRIALVTGSGPEEGRFLLDPNPRRLEALTATTTGVRAQGYRRAIAQHNLEFRPEYISTTGFRGEDAYKATLQFFDLAEPPTAIITFDSLLAVGVLQAFAHLGVTCPNDCSLISFDDPDWATIIDPPLTVLSQPVYELGLRAASLLLRRMAGETADPVNVRLSAKLIERGSVAPASGR
jgi:DNA-binding LacI/PurR family transcriptional regulator